MTDLNEAAWGLIANAGNGDWTTQTPEWQEAAARWRDRYHAEFASEPDALRAALADLSYQYHIVAGHKLAWRICAARFCSEARAALSTPAPEAEWHPSPAQQAEAETALAGHRAALSEPKP